MTSQKRPDAPSPAGKELPMKTPGFDRQGLRQQPGEQETARRRDRAKMLRERNRVRRLSSAA